MRPDIPLKSEEHGDGLLRVDVIKTFLGGSRDTGGREFSLDAQLSVQQGITMLFGASGSGKTTLLDCVAGVLTPDSGKVVLGSESLFDSSARVNLPPAKRGVGYVFQDLALFPHLSVESNVEYGSVQIAR